MLFASSVLAAEDAKLSAALKQAQECGDATVKGDYEKLVDLTHPAVVKLAGGKEKMIDLLKKSIGEMKDQGIIFESSKSSAADSYIRSGTALFCVIPTVVKLKVEKKSETKSEKKRLTLPSFLLGVSNDDGKTWKFLDGAQGEPGLRKLVPEIPKDLKFPEKAKPVFESIDENDK